MGVFTKFFFTYINFIFYVFESIPSPIMGACCRKNFAEIMQIARTVQIAKTVQIAGYYTAPIDNGFKSILLNASVFDNKIF